MTVGVGDGVAQVAAPEQPRLEHGWHARFLVAFGGAVLVVSFLLLGSMWTEGLRAATFDDLRADLSQGSVQEWYVADNLSKGDFDRMVAHQSPLQNVVVDEAGVTTTTGAGELAGGILVWRTRGESGWKVAAAALDLRSIGSVATDASDESKALVERLRAAGVSMRPYDWGDTTGLENVAKLGAVLVIIGLVTGAAPRVGTRWFWFWVLLGAPLALGFIAYAVTELIGWRRRPDPPLKKRLPGIVGFIAAPCLSIALAVGADFLRSRGVPLPL